MTNNDRIEQIKQLWADDATWITDNINNIERLDEDGYPTEDSLRAIQKWNLNLSITDLFDFIKRVWYAPNFGWRETIEPHEFIADQTVHRYYLSTAGWSGNESLIYALENNQLVWSWCWVQSRRGGHYIFEVKLDEDLQAGPGE